MGFSNTPSPSGPAGCRLPGSDPSVGRRLFLSFFASLDEHLAPAPQPAGSAGRAGGPALRADVRAVALGRIPLPCCAVGVTGSLAEVSVLGWARSTAPRGVLARKRFPLPSCLNPH